MTWEILPLLLKILTWFLWKIPSFSTDTYSLGGRHPNLWRNRPLGHRPLLHGCPWSVSKPKRSHPISRSSYLRYKIWICKKKLSEIMATKKWQKDNETLLQETIMAWFWTLLTQGASSPISTRWAPVLHVTFREVVPGIRKMDETNWANTKWLHHCELNTSAKAGICRVL